jgi:hypothetical protein
MKSLLWIAPAYFIALTLAILFPLHPSHAALGDQLAPLYIRPGPVIPKGFCQITVTTATTLAAALSAAGCGAIPNGATYALFTSESTAVRWRDDGVAPTAAVGQIIGTGTATAPVQAGFSTNFSAMQLITESGSSLLDISFYQ